MGSKWLDQGENDLLKVYFTDDQSKRSALYLGLYMNSTEPAEGSVMAASAWQASTSYSVGDIVRPTTPNGYCYRCTVAGTSGSSEPTWPTTIGDTVSDNQVTWKCVGHVISEPSGSGYARKSLSDSGWSIKTSSLPDGGDIATYAEQTFEATGAWGNIYGYFIATSNDTSGLLLAVEHFSNGPYNVQNSGDQIKVTLNIKAS